MKDHECSMKTDELCMKDHELSTKNVECLYLNRTASLDPWSQAAYIFVHT